MTKAGELHMTTDLPGDLPATFTIKQAQALGVPEYSLPALIRRRLIERIGRGIYRRTDAEPADIDLIEISHRAPGATICLETALSRHGLSDWIPDRIDIALPRGHWHAPTRAPVTWHSFDPATFTIGRDEIRLNGSSAIGVYSAERSIIDAIRLRHREGYEVPYEALRRWLDRPGSRRRDLTDMAAHFPRAETALLDALRILG
jgi:predicted transcriptional regulator of viral defense system